MESDCSDDSPECACPCACGCQNDINGGDLPFYDKVGGDKTIPVGDVGICAGCRAGNHELSAFATSEDIENMITAHKSVIAYLEERKKGV